MVSNLSRLAEVQSFQAPQSFALWQSKKKKKKQYSETSFCLFGDGFQLIGFPWHLLSSSLIYFVLSSSVTDQLSSFFSFFSSMCTCLILWGLCMWVVSSETRRGRQVSLNRSCRQLWAATWMLGVNPRSSAKEQLVLYLLKHPSPSEFFSWMRYYEPKTFCTDTPSNTLQTGGRHNGASDWWIPHAQGPFVHSQHLMLCLVFNYVDWETTLFKISGQNISIHLRNSCTSLHT